MNERIFYSEYFYEKGSKDTGVLERNAKDHPYSSLAAFLLLYHYKKNSHPGFEAFARKTALLFNNTNWLQFQLCDTSIDNPEQEIINHGNVREETEVSAEGENEFLSEIYPVQNSTEDTGEVREHAGLPLENDEPITENLPLENTQPEIEVQEDSEEIATSNAFQQYEYAVNEESVNEDEAIAGSIIEYLPEQNSQTENAINETSGVADENNSFQQSGHLENEETTNKNELIAEETSESLLEQNSQTENEVKEISEVTATSDSFQQQEHSGNEETVYENEIIAEETAGNLPEAGSQSENEAIEFSGEAASSSSFEQQEQSGNEEAVHEDEIIAFEPLHTVDYFASQGIKINEELISNDKLGSQMKSFTAWLKSMKKLHPGKLEEQDLATEKLIQTSADASNINTEILTEAMAEVLIKQDKKEKAIEMFSKLSLINPSKSAYFAARIESIKSN